MEEIERLISEEDFDSFDMFEIVMRLGPCHWITWQMTPHTRAYMLL